MTFPFACCPVIRECSIKENPDTKKGNNLEKMENTHVCYNSRNSWNNYSSPIARKRTLHNSTNSFT